jgi:hypothetical protein
MVAHSMTANPDGLAQPDSRAHEPPKQWIVIARVVIIQPEARLLALPCELEIGGRRAAFPSRSAEGQVAQLRHDTTRCVGRQAAGAEMVAVQVGYT